MIVVVSDLHLSEGLRDKARKLSPMEDFFFDEEFSRFLTYLDSIGPEPVHLIINGDFFDFLQVPVTHDDIEACPPLAKLSVKEKAYIGKYGAKTDEVSTILRLEKISRGHAVFFEALGRFLAVGNRLTVVIGNHDVELFWPGVQRRFRELLGVEELATAAADGGTLESTIDFAQLAFYDRDYAFYAEHGNQYEGLNSFRFWLYPVLPQLPTEINLPVGSLFVRYLLNKVEEINPFADNIKPNTKYVAWAMKNDPLGFRHLLHVLWRFVVTLAKSYRRSGRLAKHSAADLIAFREQTDSRIREISKRYGINGDVQTQDHPLRQVLNLHTLPINENKWRFFTRGLFAYLDVWLFLLGAAGAAVFIALAVVIGAGEVASVVALLLAVVAIASGNLFFSVGSAMSKETLKAVKSISRAFNGSDNPVRYITFGHTHEPEIAALEDGTVYFNTGTWGVIFNDEEELIREKKQFAVLIIDKPGNEPKLMRWNDALGLTEPLPLFDSRPMV